MKRLFDKLCCNSIKICSQWMAAVIVLLCLFLFVLFLVGLALNVVAGCGGRWPSICYGLFISLIDGRLVDSKNLSQILWVIVTAFVAVKLMPEILKFLTDLTEIAFDKAGFRMLRGKGLKESEIQDIKESNGFASAQQSDTESAVGASQSLTPTNPVSAAVTTALPAKTAANADSPEHLDGRNPDLRIIGAHYFWLCSDLRSAFDSIARTGNKDQAINCLRFASWHMWKVGMKGTAQYANLVKLIGECVNMSLFDWNIDFKRKDVLAKLNIIQGDLYRHQIDVEAVANMSKSSTPYAPKPSVGWMPN